MSYTKADSSKSLFNPFGEQLVISPHETYHRLRSEEPVHWSESLQCWVVTRIGDVQAILNDPEFAAARPAEILAEFARRTGRNYDPAIRALDAMLFFKEGERHRHDRRTIAKILNRKPLSRLEPVIERYAVSLLSKLSGRSEYDVIEAFADPLPQFVMAHILEMPLSDTPVLGKSLANLTLIFDVATLDTYDKVNRNVIEAFDLIKSRIVEANGGSTENALSIIYDGTSGSDAQRLTDAAALTLFAYRVGAETTMGLIGMLVRTLIHQPRIHDMVRANPALAPTIVSEVLRLESNVQRAARVAQTTRVLGGKTIKAGDRLMLLLGAANRDPEAFAQPDDMSLTARNVPDVVFGAGHHFCQGASLARLEGRIALKQFVQLPPLEQAGEEQWYSGRSIRRLTRLPVRVAGSASTRV